MKTIKEDIKNIKRFASVMPKTLNEVMDFNQQVPMDEMEEPIEEPMEEPEAPAHEPEEEAPSGMDVKAFIDDIRKKSLKGMAQLADNPDDPNYDILKKIWQICDKAYNDQKQGQMGQTQPQVQQVQQVPVQPQQPMN